jgi:hypothetical protein
MARMPGILQSPLARAQAEITRLRQARAKLDSSRREAEMNLKKIESLMPSALTDALLFQGEPDPNGPNPRQAVDQLNVRAAHDRSVIEMSSKADGELVKRLIEAMQALIECEAREADAQADKIEEKLRAHLVKRQTLLDALQTLEGSDYMPVANHTRALADVMSKAGRALIAAPVRFTIPVSEQLALQLAEARAAAARIRQKQVRSSGQTTGTLDQILTQIQEPFWIGPSEGPLRVGCEEKGQAALRKWEQSGERLLAERSPWWNGFEILYTVHWKDGVLTNCSARIELVR